MYALDAIANGFDLIVQINRLTLEDLVLVSVFLDRFGRSIFLLLSHLLVFRCGIRSFWRLILVNRRLFGGVLSYPASFLCCFDQNFESGPKLFEFRLKPDDSCFQLFLTLGMSLLRRQFRRDRFRGDWRIDFLRSTHKMPSPKIVFPSGHRVIVVDKAIHLSSPDR